MSIYCKLLKKKYKHDYGCQLMWRKIIEEIGEIKIAKHGWKAMSRKIVPYSFSNMFNTQIEMVNALNKEEQKIYRIPKTLEAMVCASTIFLKENKKLFDVYYIRCEENVGGYQSTIKQQEGLVVAGFDLNPDSSIGVTVICDF